MWVMIGLAAIGLAVLLIIWLLGLFAVSGEATRNVVMYILGSLAVFSIILSNIVGLTLIIQSQEPESSEVVDD